MGPLLFLEWIDEEIDDLNLALILHGVHGLLGEFERWLERNGHLSADT